jgi:hypothetical protein
MEIILEFPQKPKNRIAKRCCCYIPFLGIYLKECKSAYYRDNCTTRFISSTIYKIRNQPACPSTDECIKKM